MPRPVLIFNSIESITVAVSRSLHRRGIPATFADIGGSPFPGGRAFRQYVRLPNFRFEPDAFIDRLTSLIQQGKYDALFPCSDAAMVAISPHYNRLRSLLYVGCPEPAIVNRVLDKQQTVEAARSCGLRVPITYHAPNITALDNLRNQLCFPLIAKPRSKMDERSHEFKSRYFATFNNLRDAFLVNPRFGAENLLQEYCGGEGVGIEVLFERGEALAVFQHRRLKELPVSGGGSVLSVSEALDPMLVDSAVRLLRRIEWQGVAMVEFRYDRTAGSATLMEVNGRYWGSLPLAIASGVDFPFFEWQLAHGQRPSVPTRYRTGLRLHWVSGDLRRVSSLFTEAQTDEFPRPSKWAESGRFLKDCLIPSHHPLWHWRDPRPAIREFKRALRSVVADFWRLVADHMKFLVAQYRCLGLRTTLALFRIRASSALGLDRGKLLPENARIRSILFVCWGNKIRSPMAEALLLKYLSKAPCRDRIVVSSAGLLSELETRADERARIVAREFGVSLDDHRPRHLTRALIEQADVIFVMDNLNEARMRVSYPSAMEKVCYLGAHTESRHRPRGVEIPDPNLGRLSDIRACYAIIEKHIRKLEKTICTEPERSEGSHEQAREPSPGQSSSRAVPCK
jgi:protein-tyrosine-phosphatase/predicted ATP-grasp superfamily ATP-dependent carboligase